MNTTKLLFAALVSLMMLTTACGKTSNSEEVSGGGSGVGSSCTNCTGFVNGPTAFSGNVTNGVFRIDGLQVIADQNSLATVFDSSPRINGTYQGLVTGGNLVASGSACIPDGSYQVQGLQVGMVSQDLHVQKGNPLWVSLVGPTKIKAPLYIQLKDTNGDDMGDAGTVVYLWLHCNGAWTATSMSAY